MQESMPSMDWVKPLHPVGPDDNPASRLIGRVHILDADFHVNAEQVEDVECEDGIDQEPVAGIGQTYVEQIQEFCQGPGETVRIQGRQYLLVITPYQK